MQNEVEANALKQLAHQQTDEQTEKSLIQIAKGLDPANDQLSVIEVYKIKKLVNW